MQSITLSLIANAVIIAAACVGGVGAWLACWACLAAVLVYVFN